MNKDGKNLSRAHLSRDRLNLILSQETLIHCIILRSSSSLAHDNTWIIRKALFRRVAACRSKTVFTSARKIKWILRFMSATRDAYKISTHLCMSWKNDMYVIYINI